MKKRTLGGGFEVSALGLGCMGMSEFYGPYDDTQSIRVLQKAIDSGLNFLDTADMYGPHHNEKLIGGFLSETDVDVKIATKFGIVRKPGEYRRKLDNSPAYARKACESSLTRLGVDRIDLYYVHRINSDEEIEDTIGGLSRLVADGKIDRIGLCEVSSETLRRAHAVHPITAVQTEYSLWSRHVEDDILKTCRELGIGFVAYSPLGRGFLTGRFQSDDAFEEGDFRANLPRFEKEAMRTNRSISDVVGEMAKQHNCTPAQLSLAWLLWKGSDIVPIPGTKNLRHLTDNIEAVVIEIDDAAWNAFDNTISRLPVQGARYTNEGMKGVNA
ncbi:MAG: aldo/keto reductase [Pseudoruegeria sp.]